MSTAASAPEPWELLLARVLLGVDGLVWLGLGALALIDHLLRHQFDCYAGCGIASSNAPAAGFRGAIKDPAVILCLLVAAVQWVLAWRLSVPRRAMSLLAAGFQLVAAIGVTITTFAVLPAIAPELSLLAAAPALGVAALILSRPVRGRWDIGDTRA